MRENEVDKILCITLSTPRFSDLPPALFRVFIYFILDQIIELYVENDLGFQQIINKGFDPIVVKSILKLIDLSEYKRRQAPIGIKISDKGFGKDRRYPITNKWTL